MNLAVLRAKTAGSLGSRVGFAVHTPCIASSRHISSCSARASIVIRPLIATPAPGHSTTSCNSYSYSYSYSYRSRSTLAARAPTPSSSSSLRTTSRSRHHNRLLPRPSASSSTTSTVFIGKRFCSHAAFRHRAQVAMTDRDILPDFFKPSHYDLVLKDLDFSTWSYKGTVRYACFPRFSRVDKRSCF